MIRLMEGFEKQEYFPQREEIMSIIHSHVPSAVITREMNDLNGPCVINMIGINSNGIKVDFQYIRKGVWPDAEGSLVTTIHMSYTLPDGYIIGETIAEYDDSAGKWKYFSDDIGKRWMSE